MMQYLKDLGEYYVVEQILNLIKSSRASYLPPGDDAVALKLGNYFVVVNVDTLIARYCMLPGMTLYDLGWRVVTASASDLASKLAQPKIFLISISMPGTTPLEDVLDFTRGAIDASRYYGAELCGGDTNESSDIVVSAVGIGLTDIEPLPRSGLRPGDVVAVTGAFGYTGLVFKAYYSGVELDRLPRKFIEKTYRPRARVDIVPVLREIRSYLTASSDSSDGLVRTLYNLAEASGVSIVLDRLPISDEVSEVCAQFGFSPEEVVLYGGEEFELVLGIRPSSIDEVIRRFHSIGTELLVVGRATEGRGVVYLKSGSEVRKLPLSGWEYFRK
ncbi:MAG: thiamine-phosphate kinase [Thermoprotei archaeon]|nr:MAG: thiamine-phosphate kinase [Thermoprotei archaeon]